MIGMTSETAKSEVPIFRLAAELRKGVDYFFFFLEANFLKVDSNLLVG